MVNLGMCWGNGFHPGGKVGAGRAGFVERGARTVERDFSGTAEVAYFHGWSDAKSKLVGFEQLLYLRQPGYGPSYIVGKSQLDKMIARASHQAEASGDSRVEPSSLRGKPFSLQQTFAAIWPSGIIPPSIIDSEFLERLR